MSSIPSNIARVPGTLTADLLRTNLRDNNVKLLEVQTMISTGKRVNRPSDDPSVMGGVTLLNRELSLFAQQISNLSRAQTSIDSTGQALADVSNILLEAQNIASSQVGVGSTPETRVNQAQVIAGQITALVDIANRSVRGVYLFAGENANIAPFEEHLGGVRYTGSRNDLQADLGLLGDLGVNLNGADAFGALSARVTGTVDLDPDATANTRLVDVVGVRGVGVTLGQIELTVDASPVTVDLTGADTLGDIATRINNAIDGIDPTAGALAVSTDGLTLTANVGHTIAIADIGQGVTAADLGIAVSATSGSVVGSDVDPKLSEQTLISSFGPAVDLASGLKITVGSTTTTVDFAGLTTVRQMMNKVQAADLGVRLEINDAATGFNLVNETSGLTMSVGEESGGTTASDLGLRSLDTTTLLSDFRFGLGISTVTGNDIRIHTHDGTDIDVDLTTTATVGDVIAAINAAGGGSVTASLASDGNGLVIDDNTVGGDSFSIVDLNGSLAADHLGIETNAGAASTITGQDNAQVRVESVFTHLMMLHDGLLSNDEQMITAAGEALHTDVDEIASSRAVMGVRSQQVAQQVSRLEEKTAQNQSLLSQLQDADYNEVISRFVQLQQQIEGSMLAGQRSFSLSLLDFLR
jgi:flagellar hook-associated protein 3 FlgL